jgi:hypothetical protein
MHAYMGDMARSWRRSKITWKSNQYKCIGHEFGRPYQLPKNLLLHSGDQQTWKHWPAPILVYILDFMKKVRGKSKFWHTHQESSCKKPSSFHLAYHGLGLWSMDYQNKAFLAKLGRNILNNEKLLWVNPNTWVRPPLPAPRANSNSNLPVSQNKTFSHYIRGCSTRDSNIWKSLGSDACSISL